MNNNAKVEITFNTILKYLLICQRGYLIYNLTIYTKI